MLFHSLEFLIFFPVVTLLYFLIPSKFRYLWLLFASYFFYMSQEPSYALFLILATVITWISGGLIYKVQSNVTKKLIVAIGFILTLSFLIYFIPGFIMLYFGAPALESILAKVPAKVTTALATVGHILPALGLGMLMNLLFKSSLVPFLIFGFVATAYLKLGTMPVAFIGVGFAIMHYMYSRKESAQ